MQQTPPPPPPPPPPRAIVVEFDGSVYDVDVDVDLVTLIYNEILDSSGFVIIL